MATQSSLALNSNNGNSSQASSSFGSSIFEPDVILPGHFLSNKGQGLQGGERRLMAALLSDGIEAYVKQATASEAARRRSRSNYNALEWIDKRDDSYVFSFDNVCQCLGINAEYLRLGLQRYVKSVRSNQALGVQNAPVWRKIRRPRKK